MSELPNSRTFSSLLATQINRFLQFKRAAGYRYVSEERELLILDRFLASYLPPEAPIITDEIVRAYLAGQRDISETTRSHRLSLLRQLCSFMALEDLQTFIPPPRYLGIHSSEFVPRILSRAEGREFIKACLHYPRARSSPLRGMVHGTLFLLLFLTGMRLGEAVSLTVDDVDLQNEVLKIRNSKFGKSRLVPMAKDLTDRMRQCLLFVEGYLGVRGHDDCFFPGPKGARCSQSVLHTSFRNILADANIPWMGPGKGPRKHDLRHSYACLRMLMWFEQGADLGVKLPLLATYMGHVNLSSTQYYLRLTEDLLSEVTSRYQARFGSIIEERRIQ